MTLCIQITIPHRGGLPHSDIHGSTPARGSPWLFAACHVLHRLLVPRHPPNALLLLDISSMISQRRPLKPITHRSHPHTKVDICEPSYTLHGLVTQHTPHDFSSCDTVQFSSHDNRMICIMRHTCGTQRSHQPRVVTTPLNVDASIIGQPIPRGTAYRSDLMIPTHHSS